MKFKIGLLIIFILMFIFSAYKIVDILYAEKTSNELYNNILSQTKMEESKFISVDFTDLLKTNSDTIGWIVFNEINYPFVQGKDNEYYLGMSFETKPDRFGTLFLDYRNVGFSNNNMIIYGHNANNIMFGSLKNLLKKSYFENGGEDIIKISTPDANYNFKIFSVYTIEDEDYFNTISFNKIEFNDFINTIIKRSYYKFDVLLNEEDKILTLLTCDGNSGTTRRTVVHAKMLETEER